VGSLSGKTVVLCVTGSVAAYKAAWVARLLVAAGADVRPVVTEAGARFLGPVTLSGLTGHRVESDMWDASYSGEKHVDLAALADVVVVAPATADTLSRLAHGRADDLVAAIALCATCPVVVAPAMHPAMWSHPATQANVRALEASGRVARVGPVVGPVASGEVGLGRMAEPEAIAAAVEAALVGRDLAGRTVVVTAGPTYEDIDPVRFLGNRSSGKMGFAIAARAAERGAAVHLVAGPVSLETPRGVTRHDVRSALQMRAALAEALGPDLARADALVMAAAVADYRPATASDRKIKKSGGGMQAIDLAENPDLLAEIGARRARSSPVLVGFALETGSRDDVLAYARKKLAEKRVDVVVANHADASLGRDDNDAALVTAEGADWVGVLAKSALADRILDAVAARLPAR